MAIRAISATRAAPRKWFGSTPPSPPRPPVPRPTQDSPRPPVPRPPSVGGATGALTPGSQVNSSGGGPATPRPIPGPGPGPTPAPSPGDGGGGGGGGGSIDWRNAAYNARIAEINRALADYEAELGLSASDYGTDYLTGIRQLGYRPGEGFSANVDIFSLPVFEGTNKKGETEQVYPDSESVSEAIQAAMSKVTNAGQWDYEGQFSPFNAAARGTDVVRNDFASRGNLRSSDFAMAYAEFQNRMQDQLNAMETGRERYYRDAAIDLGQQRAQAEERRQAARRDAMMTAALMAGG